MHCFFVFSCAPVAAARKQEDEAKKGGEHPLWQMRTKDEARAFWQEEFGHLAADEEEEERPRWKTTFS